MCRTFLLPGASGQLLKRRVSYRKATAAQAPIFSSLIGTCGRQALAGADVRLENRPKRVSWPRNRPAVPLRGHPQVRVPT